MREFEGVAVNQCYAKYKNFLGKSTFQHKTNKPRGNFPEVGKPLGLGSKPRIIVGSLRRQGGFVEPDQPGARLAKPRNSREVAPAPISSRFLCSHPPSDRAEQRLRMCRDGRGLGSKLVSFAKGFSKHLHILAIIKVDSEYLRFSFKAKVDYFILYLILVSTFVIFLLLFSMNKRRRTKEASPL